MIMGSVSQSDVPIDESDGFTLLFGLWAVWVVSKAMKEGNHEELFRV